MKDTCKGCITHDDELADYKCYWDSHNKDGSCPCSKCLVKVMCNVACDVFEEWNCRIEPPMNEEEFAEWEEEQKIIMKESMED
jgi:hypothetical protein